MRIIAGIARGRRLFAPKGRATRPTPDRVREALFSILGNSVAGTRVLDLYSGTGALALESLSRGAASAVMVENARTALNVMHRNVELSGLQGAQIVPQEAERALRTLARQQHQFDLVFLDPPYALGALEKMLQLLVDLRLLLSSAFVVCEHHGRAAAPCAPPELTMLETRTFGDVALSFLRYESACKI